MSLHASNRFALAIVFLASTAPAETIQDIEAIGLETTRPEVLIDMLPRPLPTELSDEELAEFSRRVANLGIFDSIEVNAEGNKLKVSLRRKRTLTPLLSFSTGKTLEDSSATLGLLEHDFLGDGSHLGGKVSYAERGFNFMAWIEKNPYSATRWTTEYAIYRLSSGFRFDDTLGTWSRNRMGGFIEWITPFKYDSHLQYEFMLQTYHESFSNVQGPAGPREAMYFGGLFETIYDRYKWHDLTPSGYKLVGELRAGMMTTERFRGEARFKLLSAMPVGPETVVLFNGNVAAINPGDPNHSLLIGSQQGVRGLPDSFYRNATSGYANLELRHSFGLFPRFYVQPTLFVDSGVFQPMNSTGQTSDWKAAVSTGFGLRLVPTGFTNLLLRLDGGRLHLPTQGWFYQVGISQYF